MYPGFSKCYGTSIPFSQEVSGSVDLPIGQEHLLLQGPEWASVTSVYPFLTRALYEYCVITGTRWGRAALEADIVVNIVCARRYDY